MRSFVRFSHTDHDCESAALLSLSDRFLNIAATIQVISCARVECADALSIAVLFCMIHLAQCCHSMRCCFRWTFFCLCSGHKSATSLAVAVPPPCCGCPPAVVIL